jgi:phage tail-like protein
MPDRTSPYGAFNFTVEVQGIELGGFSEVTGLGSDIEIAEYRNGNERENHVRKVAGLHKVSDVTLKRGIINSATLWEWVEEARVAGPAAQKSVVITLQNESHEAVQSWILRGVIPMKYTGPTLAGKGGGDVAMEEVVLSAEALTIEA